MRPALMLVILPVVLAGCQEAPDARKPASDHATPSAAAAPTQTSAATGPEPSPIPAVSSSAAAVIASIPDALHGRWGMVAADCSSKRGDDKGQLTITSDSLRFYESVGRIAAVKRRTDTRVDADYAFTGEGMEWTRTINLALSADGKTLTRTNRGGDEPGGPFTYTRCAA